jgi:hypothetical protein
MNANDLRRSRRIERPDLPLCPQAMTTDDQVIFLSQLVGYMIQCRLHAPGNLGILEICKRLIPELALGRARLYFGRESNSCHSENDCSPSG